MNSETFKNQEVPIRYKEANISNINTIIAGIIKKNCEDMVFKRGMYIHGSVGVGKTYSSYAIYNHVREQKLPVKLIKSSRLTEATKEQFQGNSFSEDVEENKNILKDIKEFKGLLIIDDIGTEKLTENSIAVYLACIDNRYENEYPTIYTSNLSLDELKERIGDRIVSRIYEGSNVFLLEGTSKRL